jgi:pyridoxine 4-dehydrogenase
MMEPPHGESVAERFETLAAMREEGLIRHLGLSNIDTCHLAEARAIAPVAAVQNHFHAGKRDDAELLTACEEAGIAIPGTGSPAHLAENVAAGSITLTPEDLSDLA